MKRVIARIARGSRCNAASRCIMPAGQISVELSHIYVLCKNADKNKTLLVYVNLIPSLLGCIFIRIPLVIFRFYTTSESFVEIKIVQTLAINLLISISPS